MESATFRLEDPQCLVEASLACPCCLHATDWSARAGSEPAAACRCPNCGHQRDVALTGPQMLRLGVVDDPDDAPLDLGPSLQAVRRAFDGLA